VSGYNAMNTSNNCDCITIASNAFANNIAAGAGSFMYFLDRSTKFSNCSCTVYGIFQRKGKERIFCKALLYFLLGTLT
jgi:hypothetical protein